MKCISIWFSLVLFRHTIDDIKPLLQSIDALAAFSRDFRYFLCVYNASPLDPPSVNQYQIKSFLSSTQLSYQAGPNVGFGRANNINFTRSSISVDDLIIVVNPDIKFGSQDLLPLLKWMLDNPDCTCAAPLILQNNGHIQYSAKQNPTFLSLLLGRFGFLKCFSFFTRYDYWHKNRGFDYLSEVIPCPYLSGCFLVIPAWAFSKIGGFYEGYFLHVEDADIVRRLSSIGLTCHNPIGFVYHGWSRGSHFSLSQNISLVRSFFLYCLIWGFRFY